MIYGIIYDNYIFCEFVYVWNIFYSLSAGFVVIEVLNHVDRNFGYELWRLCCVFF